MIYFNKMPKVFNEFLKMCTSSLYFFNKIYFIFEFNLMANDFFCNEFIFTLPGHMLFEMCAGYELCTFRPSAVQLSDIEMYPQVKIDRNNNPTWSIHKMRIGTLRISISGREISRVDIHGIGKSFHQHRGIVDS